MVTRTIALLAVSALLACGCTDLTEFDSSITTGIHIVSSSDLTVVQTLTGIEGGNSLCAPYQDIFLVATTEGILLRFETDTFEQTGSFAVDQPSSAGFFDMAYSPMENNLYLIGSLGKIIEVSLPDCNVVDAFSFCSSPVDLLIANGRPYLYVADTATETIIEVHIISNGWSRLCYMKSAPVCMAADQAQDTILVGTLTGVDLLSTTGSGVIFRRTFKETPPMTSVVTIQGDTVLCGVMSFSNGDKVVTIPKYFPELGDFNIWAGAVPLEGDNHCIRDGRDGIHAYVLSYLGNSVSRLTSYNIKTYTVDEELDLPGYPMDLEVTVNGFILVLTTE